MKRWIAYAVWAVISFIILSFVFVPLTPVILGGEQTPSSAFLIAFVWRTVEAVVLAYGFVVARRAFPLKVATSTPDATWHGFRDLKPYDKTFTLVAVALTFAAVGMAIQVSTTDPVSAPPVSTAGQPAETTITSIPSNSAMSAGDADAWGYRFLTGQGAVKDTAQAFHWFSVAAELGNANAQANLGVMLVNGTGVPRDVTQGLEWLIIANAEAGNGDAEFEAPLQAARSMATAEENAAAQQRAQMWLAQRH
jgi:hypothetical protein